MIHLLDYLYNSLSQENKPPKMSVTDLILFAKLYGFAGDNEVYCGSLYLEKWANASYTTVYNSIEKLESLHLLKKIPYFQNQIRKNKFLVEKKYIDDIKGKLDDSSSLLKNESYFVISKALRDYQIDHGLKGYEYLLHGLVNYCNMGGKSFDGSIEYCKGYLISASDKQVSKVFNSLLKKSLIIDSNGYKTTYSVSYTPSIKEYDNTNKAQSLIDKEKISEILNSLLDNGVLSSLITDKPFLDRLYLFINSKEDMTEQLLRNYLSYSLGRFLNKRCGTTGLFITMVLSTEDYQTFLKSQSK